MTMYFLNVKPGISSNPNSKNGEIARLFWLILRTFRCYSYGMVMVHTCVPFGCTVSELLRVTKLMDELYWSQVLWFDEPHLNVETSPRSSGRRHHGASRRVQTITRAPRIVGSDVFLPIPRQGKGHRKRSMAGWWTSVPCSPCSDRWSNNRHGFDQGQVWHLTCCVCESSYSQVFEKVLFSKLCPSIFVCCRMMTGESPRAQNSGSWGTFICHTSTVVIKRCSTITWNGTKP